MAEFHNAFLDAYFASHAQALQQAKQDQDKEEFSRKLAWEQTQHTQDLNQRTQQFQAEQAYRDAVFKNTQQQQSHQLEREHQEDWTKATDKGMFAMPKPQDQNTNIMPSQMQPAVPQMPSGPSGGGIGPTPEQAGLSPTSMLAPPQAPQVPIQAQLPAAAQLPSPSMATPVPTNMVPGGAPDGQMVFQKTPQQMNFEAAEGKRQGEQTSWPTWTADQHESLPGVAKVLGVQPGDKYDPKIQEEIVKGLLNKDKEDQTKGMDPFKAQLAAWYRDPANAGKQPGNSDLATINKAVSDSKESTDTILARALGAKLNETKISNEEQAGSMYGEGLLRNANMPVDKKYSSEITAYLQKQGYPGMPKPLAPQEDTAFNAAITSMRTMDQIAAKLKDPLVNNNMGPLMGNAQDLSQRLGKDFINKNPGAIESMQEFRTLVSGNLVNELKVINPRAAATLLDFIKGMAPNERMEPSMFAGALDGMRQISYNRIKQSLEKQWGGKAPPQALEAYGPPPKQPIEKENPLWRKAGDANYISKDDTRVIKVGDKRISVYHDGGDDKFYPLMTIPK